MRFQCARNPDFLLECANANLLQELKHIFFNNQCLSTEAIDFLIAALSQCTALESLDLSSCALDDETIKKILSVLCLAPSKKFKKLNLSNLKNIGSCAKEIASLFSCFPGLDIDLSCCNLNAESVEVLSKKFSSCPDLKIQFCGNNIGKEGALAVAKALPDCKKININFLDCKISYRSIAYFKRAFETRKYPFGTHIKFSAHDNFEALCSGNDERVLMEKARLILFALTSKKMKFPVDIIQCIAAFLTGWAIDHTIELRCLFETNARYHKFFHGSETSAESESKKAAEPVHLPD